MLKKWPFPGSNNKPPERFLKKIIRENRETTSYAPMGAFLDKPITEKETHVGAGNNLEWACAHMQGWRVSMEVHP